jgi:acyl-coenzyme A thioesterase PaaI-like protein
VKVSFEELTRLLADAEFLKPFGFVLESCALKECTIRVPYAVSLERPGGIVSGITLMAVADVAMWVAVMTERGAAEQWVTTDMKTAFLSGARDDIHCTARVLKLGKRTAYGTAECRTARGDLLTHHVLTYALVNSAQPPSPGAPPRSPAA